MAYPRFAIMILVSTLVMFGLMYLNTYTADHLYFSQTREWMAVMMGAAMTLIMLGFMQAMYKDRRANIAIAVTAAAIFGVSLGLVRSQATVDDRSWMKAMIPHHSIAIMTSRRAHIKDPRVRKLADGIIRTQVQEIGQMKQLLAELDKQPVPSQAPDLPPGQ